MKERKDVFKIIGYLLMIITITVVAFLAPKFIEKEVNAAIINEEYTTTEWYQTKLDNGDIAGYLVNNRDYYGPRILMPIYNVFTKDALYDNTVPTLPTVVISSDNTNNTEFAKVGDTIILTIIASEDIQTPTVTIAGQTATVLGSENAYTATYTVVAGISEGVVGINITYADKAGNAGTAVTATTDSSTVTVDKTRPTLKSVIMKSNNHNIEFAKERDTITLSLMASEDIQTPTVTIAGETATITGSGTIYQATYKVRAETPEGVAGINITYADKAGNAGTAVTATTNSSTVTVDKTKPILSTVTIESNNDDSTLAKIGDTITLRFTTSETLIVIPTVTPTVTIAGETATVTGSENEYIATYMVAVETLEGLVEIDITYADEAGNAGTLVTSTTDSSTVIVDKAIPEIPALPTVTIESDNNNPKFAIEGDTITVSMTANKDIEIPTVTIAGQSATVTGSGHKFTATYIVNSTTSGGVVGIHITYIDTVGNAGSPVTATTNSSIVTIDKTVPTLPIITIISNNEINTKFAKLGDTITLSITASENLQMPTVTIAGEATNVIKNGTRYTATYIVNSTTPEGVAKINITYADEAGNTGNPVTSTTDSSTVTVDRTLPILSTVTIKSDNKIHSNLAKLGDTITLLITSTEDIQTPTVTIAGQIAIVTGSGNIYSAIHTVVAETPEGVVGINITYADEIGNVGTVVLATTDLSTVTVDKTAPTPLTVTIESDNNNSTLAKIGDTITVKFTTSETLISIPTVTPLITIAEQRANVTGSGDTYEATYTVVAGTPEGVVGIKITYADEAGNAGLVVTTSTDSSTVAVDRTIPTLPTVTIASNNGMDPTLAKVGDEITVSIIADENIKTPTVTIAGQAATVSGSGDTYSATYTVVAGTPEGVVGINIAYADEAGNAGLPVTTITDSSTVTVDRTVPTLATVTIKSDNDNPTLAIEGDIITVSITASENLQTPTVTIAGQTAIVTGSGDTYSATYTVVAGTPEGVVGIKITYADEAGNAGLAVTTTDSSTVTVDRTIAKLTTVTIRSNNDNPTLAIEGDIITVSIIASENLQTPTVTIAGQTAIVTGSGNTYSATHTVVAETPEGVVGINIAYADEAGNVGTGVTATTDSSTVIIHKTFPTLPTVTIASNNGMDPTLAKVGDEITVSIIADKNIKTPTVTIAGQVATVAGSGDTYAATYTVVAGTPEGVVGINIAYADEAGNVGSPVTITTDSSTVTVDRTVPTLTTVTIASNYGIDPTSAKVGDTITVLITASENLQTPTVTIAGQTAIVTGSGKIYSATHTVVAETSEGVVGINIMCADVTGNAGLAVTATTDSSIVTVDKTIPKLTTVTIKSDNDNPTLAIEGDIITVSIIASENLQTPTVTIAGQTATVTGSGNTYSATHTVAVETLEGVVGISITYADEVGNTGTEVTATTDSSTVTIHKTFPTLPTVTIASNNGIYSTLAKVGHEITVSIIADKNIKTPTVTIAGQVATVAGSGDTYAATYTVVAETPEGVVGINITYFDEAGNAGLAVTATTDSSIVTVDKTIPKLTTVTIESDNDNSTLAIEGDTITVLITASENLQTPTVTIAEQSATVTGSGVTYSATYTVVAGTLEGEAGINITYADEAGNTGSPVTTTTDVSIVTVDKIIPELDTVTIASDNNASTLAKVGDIITLTIIASENIALPTVTIAGQVATVAGSGDTYSATYTVVAGTPEGVVGINITYFDEAGNAGLAVTATTDSSTVTVDRTVPTLTSVTIASNYGIDPTSAKVGDIITVLITASENLQTPTVTIAGQTAIVTGSGNTYSATHTVVEETPEGVVGINIAYADEAGNVGTGVTATTDSSTVTVDKTSPILSTVTIASNNENNTAFAKLGDTITVLITANKNIQIPVVTIAGQSATVTGSGVAYTANYVVEAGTPEGVVGISIKYVDEDDNAGREVTATTDSSTVTVNKTVPILTTVKIISNNDRNTKYALVNDTIILSIKVSEKIETPTITIAGQVATVMGSGDIYSAVYMVEEGDPIGEVAINITYVDVAGNEGVPVTATTDSSTVTIVEKIPLELAVTIKSDNEFNAVFAKVGDLITLTIIADKNIQTPTVTIAGQTAIVTGSGDSYIATYTVDENTPEGVVGINITYTDEAGNAGLAVTAPTDSSKVTVDRVAPNLLRMITASSDNPIVSHATIGNTITAAITVDEDVHIPMVMIAGNFATVTGSGTNYTAIYTVEEGDKTHQVKVIAFCTDMAGNSLSIEQYVGVFIYDTELPVDLTTVTIESNNNNPNMAKLGDTIKVSMEADNNIMLPTVTIAGQTATVTGSGDTYEATYTIVAETPEGEAGINITYVDEAGNAGTPVTTTTDSSIVTIDKTVPVLDPVAGGSVNTEDVSNWIATPATANDNVDGDISSLVGVNYFDADGTELADLDAARSELASGKNVIVKYNVSDASGNQAAEVFATFTLAGLDNDAPVIVIKGYDVLLGYLPIYLKVEDVSSWIPPTATVTDNVDTGLTAQITYFKFSDFAPLTEDEVRPELAAGRTVKLKYSVSDAAGNNAHVNVFVIVYSPVIEPVNGATVTTEEASSWTAPTATAKDHTGVDISDRVVVTYFKADGTTSLANLTAARTELGEGRNVVVKYNVNDYGENQAAEVSATFRAN